MTTRVHSYSTIVTAIVAFALGSVSASAQFMVGPAVDYGNISEPSGMTNGDFNGDGALDLATTADNVDRVVVFQNSGSGTFGTTMDFLLPASSSPQDVIAGDFDGDMDLDLAVALRDPGGNVQFMTNNGGGSFSLGTSVSVGDRPRGLSVADFDGDMDLDLAVANRDSDTMSILTNNGGAFTAATVAVGQEPRHTAFGNFLPDAGLEIAVTNADSRTVSILDEVGGVFSVATTLSVGPAVKPDGIVAADLDGNGLDDLAVAAGEPSVAAVFMNDVAGFNPAVSYPTLGINSSDIVAADLNCDGSLDLAISNSDSNNVSMLANNGNGTFAAAQLVATGVEPDEITFGDWDGDLDADLATANKSSSNISALLNFTCSVAPTGDFNEDGLFDCLDVDALVAEIVAGSNTGGFDMTGDGFVDNADLTEWLAVAGAENLPSGNSYLEGDANLDGTVDGLDFIEWNGNKFTETAAWCSGDFNADGFVDGQDFIIWNGNKFTSADGLAAVPEPASTSYVVWLVIAAAASLRRRA